MNSEGKDIGMFIVADGKENDVIASYHIRIPKTGTYRLWLESFSSNFSYNDIKIKINTDEYVYPIMFNRKTSMWTPVEKVKTSSLLIFAFHQI